MSKVIFISGIDTDAGKSYATGWYARSLMEDGNKVATQKFIQTGNTDFSEDIEVHRRIMGIGFLPEDLDHTTAPIIFSYPASAQLAAAIDGKEIDLSLIDKATKRLKKRYDVVLIEGAGGLMVPITDDFFALDYCCNRSIPIALVTNSRLGSINHTVLSLELIRRRNVKLECVLYNEYYDSTDKVIADDTYGFITRYVEKNFRNVPVIRIPAITPEMMTPMEMPRHEEEKPLSLSISKIKLSEMPQVTFPGTVSVVEYPTQAREALAWLSKQKIVGFDTETRPSFRKGKMNNVALVQISTPRRCFLFRVNKLGFIDELKAFIANEKVKKVGLSLKDDFNAMHRNDPEITPEGFIDLQTYVRDFCIADSSLQKIYGIIFGKRISKSQRLSNWEADTLTEAQQIYAAIDAWAALRIYQHLESGKFDPLQSPYIVLPGNTEKQ